MEHTEEVTRTQHVAAMVSGQATHKSISLVKTVSYRAPISILGPVDAMATKAGKSRNAMLTLLLEVGIDSVRQELAPEVAEKLMLAESSFIAQMLGDETINETLEE